MLLRHGIARYQALEDKSAGGVASSCDIVLVEHSKKSQCGQRSCLEKDVTDIYEESKTPDMKEHGTAQSLVITYIMRRTHVRG